MNSNCFKTVFSKRHGALVAVGEHASSQGKANGAHGANGAASLGAQSFGFAHVMRHFMGAVTASFALVALAWAQPALNALPTGGQVAQGVVQFSQSAQQLNISQASDRAAVNWQSFDIGAAAKVNVVQPSAQSVLLNRVGGTAPSQIFGQLSANGRVILVNPNGMVFGRDGSVSASAFTGSTLNISDADFMAGNERYTRDGATGAIVNRGLIQAAPGGYVALLGASVSNEGRIVAPQGDVYLAAADAVTMRANAVALPIGQSGRIKLELSPASINAAVANQKGGTIVTEGGQVYLQAAAVNAALATIIQSGSIDTTGEQGGAVHVLADGGHIRVDGSIKANSTGTDDKGQKLAGGDIYIGRDKDTNVLAAVGDASGASLESKGGFVETSGSFLKVDDISVKAKDWLLDPTDIRIVASNTATQDTAKSTSGNTTTFQDSTAVGVTEVHKATIEAAINNGTNVTITTANAPGTGEGNITIETALSFNNTGAQAATLSLLARNGITQNSGASITATGTQAVNIVMEALGLWSGQDVDHVSSQGITLNSTITTNGTVTLTGTSRNTSGVQTGPTYSWGATNNSRSGVVFNGGSGITADNFQITGTHNVATGDSFGVNGVYMSGAVNFVSTGNTNSTITGNSNAQGNFGAGMMVWDGATVRLENQGTGVTALRGSNTHAGGGNGVRIGASVNSAVINAVGHVTIGQQTAGVNAPIFIRGTLNASLNISNLGGLNILGQTGSGLTTTAVQLWDININAAGVDLVIDGVAGNATGVYIQTAPNITWTTKNLTVTGVANTTSGFSGSGVVIQRYPNVLTVNANGNIAIEGTVQGAGNGRGLYFAESGWGPQAHRLTATGNVTFRGNNRASTSNTSNAVSIVSGVQVSAGGNIVLQGETNNAAATAIFANSSGNFADWTAAANSGSGALNGNLSLRSTSGDVLIQSNQGSIVLNNQLTSTLINGSQTTSTEISGRNITIDNTGAGMATGTGTAVTGTGGMQGAVLGSGSIDTLTGVITRGTGKSTSSTAGIRIADGRAVTAKNYINIFGAGTIGSGVEISGAAALSANVVGFTGNINIAGENTSSSGAAINISNAASTITARNIATLTSSGTGSGTSLVTAGNITVGGELQVENPATARISGVISGTGMLRKRGGTGTGTLTLTGNNTYTGGTMANGGTLQVGNGGTIGSLGTGDISIASVLNINRSDTYTIADNISGTGQLWQTGAGTTVLTGTNSYAGTTAINAGVLQAGNGSETGSLGTGDVTNNAALTFNRSNVMNVSNAISGTGTINQIGVGTTALTAANTYTGTTTISSGSLQIGNASATGSLGSGGVINNANLTFNRSNAMTVSNAISGTGTINQIGAGTTALTAENTYTGTTTISAGGLQIGDASTTGSLGTGGVTNNANLILNRSNGMTVANVITGTGNISQIGAGSTILSSNNTYSGATNITGGTLQIGNGLTSGSLGSTSGVTLTNNANLTFNRSDDITIDKFIEGNGNVTVNTTGGLVLGNNINLTSSSSINLTASGAITQASGTLAATNLNMTSTSGAIGAAGQRVQTNVANLSVSAGGDIFVTEADALLVAGRTTANNGSLDIRTTNGTLRVGSFNSLTGLTAHGSGSITVSGTTSVGNGVFVDQNITATGGDVSITGTTSSAASPNAGVLSDATIQARNITLSANASAVGGGALGYYGAGGVFNASEGMTLSGSAAGTGNGFYSFSGSMTSGTGMSISGTSASGQGVGLDNAVTLTNGSSGGISITGTASDSARQAIGLQGSAMTNGGGNMVLTAVSGNIISSVGNPGAWGGVNRTNTITNNGAGAVRVVAGNNSASNSGAIDGSVLNITQNGNAGVEVRSAGTGHVTAPRVTNAGTGDIIVAAGAAIAAGTGEGAQVLTLAANTLSHTNASPGKTYVFSGAPESTGVLSNLTSGFAYLYYQGTSQPLNAAFNTGFDANPADNMSVPGGGSASNTQVFFRTATRPGFSLTLANNSKVYGEADPTTWVSTHGATLTNAVAGIGGSNTFAVSTANVLAGISGGRETGEDVGTYAYNLSANNFNTSLTAQPNLVIGKRDITLTSLTALNRVYDGTTQATITGGTFGNLHNAETLLISGLGEFVNKDAADGKVVTVANVSTLTKTNGTGNWNNYNLTTTSKTTTANITKATLTATANNDARFVTQTDAAHFNGVSLSGFVGGDTPADVDASGLAISRTNAVNDVAAGSYVGVLVPSGLTAVNYNFNYVNGDYTIVPANRLLVRTDSQSLVYGTASTFNTTAEYLDSSDNLIKTLTRTGSNNHYVFNDGAGTNISMSMKPYLGTSVAAQSSAGHTVVGSFDVKDLAYTQTGSNFSGVPVFVGHLDVTPKAVTPSASGVSKVYDGTTSMTNVVVGMTGKLTDDVVTISGTGAFAQRDAGVGLSYSVSNVVLTGADSANYYLANGSNSFSGTDGVITRASLVATANSLNTTFNGAAQSVSGFTVAGLLGSDLVSDLVGISASGATGTNVGSYANSMTVVDQTNYTVTGVDGALVINPAPITITGISGALTGTVSKVYDGTNAAVLTPANYVLTGWLGSDGATVTKTAGTYNNANTGDAKPVTVSLSRADFLASGATDLSNYRLPTSVTGAVGVITPKEVSLSSFTVADKVYDGSTLATITAGTVLTGVGSETLSVKGTGTFADKNVGDAKVVTPSDVSTMTRLDGSGSWLNYMLVNSNVTGTASITPKTIQASGLVADKVYDGSVAATVNGMAAVGVVTGDTVFVQAGSAAFADKDVSRDAAGSIAAKAVTVSGLSLAGLDARNYVLNQNTFTAQARITPKALQISALALDKVYDTTPLATIKWGGLTGLVGAEQLQVMAAGAFENAEVGTNKRVNVRFELGNGPNGGLAANYELTPLILRASIANQSAMPSVQPSPVPGVVKPASSAVTFAGPALAAVGEQVSDKLAEASCDLLNVENCACEQSKLDHVLICYVPRDATATGRVLPNNTGASVK